MTEFLEFYLKVNNYATTVADFPKTSIQLNTKIDKSLKYIKIESKFVADKGSGDKQIDKLMTLF
jgi:hypothetical protein